jgi:hypothetical protein
MKTAMDDRIPVDDKDFFPFVRHNLTLPLHHIERIFSNKKTGPMRIAPSPSDLLMFIFFLPNRNEGICLHSSLPGEDPPRN